MDDVRLGSAFRALRHRLRLRQIDVAAQAGISQDLVSTVETGGAEGLRLSVLRSVARTLGADVIVTLRWRGGELDRLLDEAHATLVGATAGLLESDGWTAMPEVSYAIYRESGSIDLLAWHPSTRTLVVVEVKSQLVSVEETLRRHDAKIRLATGIASDRFGWDARATVRLLVLPETSTSRRRVARHVAVLGRAYPNRGRELRDWLRAPWGAPGGLLFLSPTVGGRTRRDPVTPRRVRRPLAGTATHGSVPLGETDLPRRAPAPPTTAADRR